MLTWNTSEVAKIQGIQYLEMIHVSLTVFHAPAKLSVSTLTWPAPGTVSQIGHLTLTCHMNNDRLAFFISRNAVCLCSLRSGG